MSRPLSGECYQALTRYLTIREKGKRLFIWSRIYEIDNPYESKANGSQKQGQRKKKSRTQLLLTSVEDIGILFEKKVLGTRIFFSALEGKICIPRLGAAT